MATRSARLGAFSAVGMLMIAGFALALPAAEARPTTRCSSGMLEYTFQGVTYCCYFGEGGAYGCEVLWGGYNYAFAIPSLVGSLIGRGLQALPIGGICLGSGDEPSPFGRTAWTVCLATRGDTVGTMAPNQPKEPCAWPGWQYVNGKWICLDHTSPI